MKERELAVIEASTPRRLIGVGSMMGLGAMLLYLALTSPPANIFWHMFLMAMGGGSLVLGQFTWRATGEALILTETELRERSGTVLARLDDVERVERGMFAMKPSNGFNLVLRQSGARVWRPGLWWRLGRKVAVGGVTSGSQTRPVADIIQLKIQERAGR
ncbi:hypothetical protein [Thetidibacter halocola]|uniref:PH domain-containing protein n=1 Tax=Thetidibacter halocola TaxID=2827239 RepID=A0A8J7WCZ3_9RHOB|nr:hypothetical protein [Thetidibacter halocola]MBS0125305.1 hypothetical protein [Thetidibacter halocola]